MNASSSIQNNALCPNICKSIFNEYDTNLKDAIDQIKQTIKDFKPKKQIQSRSEALQTKRINKSMRNTEESKLKKSTVMPMALQKKINNILKKIDIIPKENLKDFILNEFFYTYPPKEELIDKEFPDNITFLHEICAFMDISVLKFFISEGTDLNLPTQMGGWTPLMQAIITFQEIDFFKVLIDYGADVNRINERNLFSPLHLSLLAKTLQRKNSQDSPLPRLDEICKYLKSQGSQMISKTFLKALKSEETLKLMSSFKMDQEQVDDFYQAVKQAAADELMASINAYDTPLENITPNIFKLLGELKCAGEGKAEIVNMELSRYAMGGTPFERACAVFKRICEEGKSKTMIKKFFNQGLKGFADCGANFDQTSQAFKDFSSEQPLAQDQLNTYRNILTTYIREKLETQWGGLLNIQLETFA